VLVENLFENVQKEADPEQITVERGGKGQNFPNL
jgi:hypothetical protein